MGKDQRPTFIVHLTVHPEATEGRHQNAWKVEVLRGGQGQELMLLDTCDTAADCMDRVARWLRFDYLRHSAGS